MPDKPVQMMLCILAKSCEKAWMCPHGKPHKPDLHCEEKQYCKYHIPPNMTWCEWKEYRPDSDCAGLKSLLHEAETGAKLSMERINELESELRAANHLIAKLTDEKTMALIRAEKAEYEFFELRDSYSILSAAYDREVEKARERKL